MTLTIVFAQKNWSKKKKDLEVVFDPELSFSFRCEEQINKAYSMLRLIKRNFVYLTEDQAKTQWPCFSYQVNLSSGSPSTSYRV